MKLMNRTPSARKASISLCMIIKNEAASLSACLGSVQHAVDEIIVVDTGSTDASVQIARSYGAKIISFDWNGDFSAARNAGLEAAAGDWILILDGDEELDAQSAAELKLCALHLEYDGFFVRIHNHLGVTRDSPASTVNPVLRMFRNKPEHRFEGLIHEQIAPSIIRHHAEASFHLSGIRVHHYGYANEVVQSKDKITRNIQLLQKELEHAPENAFHQFNMAVEQMRLGEHQTALVHLRQARCFAEQDTSYVHLICKYEIRCRLALGEYPNALEILDQSTALFPDYTDLWHMKGVLLLSIGSLYQAVQSLKAACKLGPAAAHYHTEHGMGTFMTSYLLGQAYERLGCHTEAVDWYLHTLQSKPDWHNLYLHTARLLDINCRNSEIPGLLWSSMAEHCPEMILPMIRSLSPAYGKEALPAWLASHSSKLTPSVKKRLEQYVHDAQTGVRLTASATPSSLEGEYRRWLVHADQKLATLPKNHSYLRAAKQARLSIPLPKE